MKNFWRNVMVLALVTPAIAQDSKPPATTAPAPQPVTTEQPPIKINPPSGGPVTAQPAAPQFESLAKKGPDGKIIQLEGVVDILAFENNKLIDQATRERCKPFILAWLADVDQLAIDNLDFIEKIEPGDNKPGMLDDIDVDDHVKLQQMSQMMSQLMSAGPLSNHLEMKGGLTRDQSGLNQQITSDYLQTKMNEIMAENPENPKDGGDAEKAKHIRINNLTRFLYSLSCKDPITSYHRIMADAAPNIDAVVASLKLTGEQAKAAAAEIPAIKAAKTKMAQKAAVRKLLNGLNFDQKRAFLTKSLELAPVVDPYANKWM